MVTAGVFMVARLSPLFELAPNAAAVVTLVGATTAFFAATVGLVQNDIKRIVAYSTCSQLGYMFVAMGVGAYSVGMFHLFTHAFFKALLFLGAGSIIHAAHSNRMSEMGGLRRPLSTTFWTFLIGSAALAGIPPLAGFWSKDEIIAEAFRDSHEIVWAVAILTAMLTAFYMTRALWLTFFGEYRGQGHPHESPRVMTVPLVILAALSVVAGFFGAPFVEGGFRELVQLGEEAHIAGFDFALAGLSVGLALVGVLVGTALYRTYRERDPLRSLGPLYTLLERKYYLDDIYLRGIVRPIQYSVSRFIYWTNQRILDAVVNGFARMTRGFGTGTDAVDRHLVDGAVNRIAIGTGWTGGLLRYIQSGNVQRYAVILFAGVAILAVIFTRV